MDEIDDELESLWLKAVDKIADEIVPKKSEGSLERSQFLLAQALLFAKLAPKLISWREKYGIQERIEQIYKDYFIFDEMEYGGLDSADNLIVWRDNEVKQLEIQLEEIKNEQIS